MTSSKLLIVGSIVIYVFALHCIDHENSMALWYPPLNDSFKSTCTCSRMHLTNQRVN